MTLAHKRRYLAALSTLLKACIAARDEFAAIGEESGEALRLLTSAALVGGLIGYLTKHTRFVHEAVQASMMVDATTYGTKVDKVLAEGRQRAADVRKLVGLFAARRPADGETIH